MRAATSILFTAVWATACHGTEQVQLDDQCRLTSECQAGLVCSAQRCRVACREDRDCPVGTTCEGSGLGAGCVPPSSPVPCLLNSDCPAGVVCIAGACHPQCVADVDCGEGRRCVDSTCDEPLLTPEVVDGGSVPPG